MSKVFDIPFNVNYTNNCKKLLTFKEGEMQNIIKDKRKSIKLSQDELAKLCGVSRQTINAIENDKYDSTLQLAFQLAFQLESTVDELFQFQGVR